MTQPQMIEFGEWLPDLPEYQNPGALIAQNVIPQLKSYRGLNSLSSFTDALANICLGTFWGQAADGTIFNFAGDTAALYELSGGDTWVDISGPSAPYSAVENWDFTKFGERVIAVQISNPMQKFDMGTDVTFLDLPGSPPQAERIATVRDFIVVGDISSLGPNFIAWSGFNNSEIWDLAGDLATQTDSQELFGRGGSVQRIVPGEYGIIFQQNSIWRMDYVGPPVVFQLDEVDRKRGTPAPNSVVWTGGLVYFYGWDGFYVFDGSQSKEISANRVSNFFAGDAANESLDNMRGAIDRRNRLILWAYSTSPSSLINNRIIIYNWGADKWAHAILDTECLDEFVSAGFTLDELDVPLPLGIDLDSIPVDSDAFQGGDISVAAFNSSHQTASFDGAPLTSIIDTKEISGENNNRMYVNAVRPLIESPASAIITVQVGSRNRLQDNVTFSAARALNSANGEANVRVNSRYQRYRLNITGGFDHGNGVRAQIRQGGRR
jgi:hypothetical protein